jgi:hypothetical protein
MIGHLSAISLERCPRSARNEVRRVIHAAPWRRVDNPVPKAYFMGLSGTAPALSTAAASLATNSRRGGQGDA